ncbi:hypothetical protein GCM10028807_20460 [Spirosoma daeguense]
MAVSARTLDNPNLTKYHELPFADCTNPATNLRTSTVGYTTASLLWNSTGYYANVYQVSYRVQGTTTWTPASTTVSEGYYAGAYNLTGLMGNTVYEWAVTRICSSTESSAMTAPSTFTTNCNNAPTSLSQYNITPVSAYLYWYDQSNAGSYEVLWRPQGSSTWNSIPGIVTQNYTLTTLTPNTSYEWGVRITCSPTVSSSLAGPSNFTTPLCNTPSSPYVNSTSIYSNSALVGWSTLGTGVTYTMQWRPQGNPTWNTVTGIPTNTYSLTGLTNNTAYEFQVQATCGQSSSSGYSNPVNFTTVCSQPTSSGENEIYAASASLYWYNTNSTFDVNWRPQGTTTWNSTTAVATSSSTYKPFTLSGLSTSTTYEWTVRTLCGGTDMSPATSIRTFTTGACTTPTSPNATAFSNSANLLWYTPAPGSLHELQWRQQGSSTWNVVSNLNGTYVTSSQVTYRLSGLTPGTAYEYQVRVFCTPSSSSSFTSPVSFTTSGCQAPTNGSYNVYAATHTSLSWTPAGALGYNLRWRKQGTTPWTTVSNISAPPYVLQGLPPSTTYEFQVEAICSTTGTSGFSNSFNFYTSGCGYSVPAPAIVTPTTARLSWTAASTYYAVEYRAMPAGSCTANNSTPWTTAVSSQTSTNTTLSGLTAGTCYQWRVIGTCTSSLTSSTGYFTTACGPAPTGLSTDPIQGTSAQLNWDNLGSGVQYEVQWRANATNATTGDGGCINNTTSAGNPWSTVSNLSTNNYNLTGLNLSSCYQWRVRVLCEGSTFSNILAFRTTNCAPAIITQQPPTSATFVVGSTASASVVATGSSLMYQWYKDGTSPGNIVAGQTSAVLSLPNVQFGQAGTYYCVVSNGCNSSTVSNGFTLVVATSSGCAGGFYTVQDGPWNTPATWSCGAVPTSADAVDIRHIVNVPASYTGLSQKITYSNGGKIVIATTGKVRVGP